MVVGLRAEIMTVGKEMRESVRMDQELNEADFRSGEPSSGNANSWPRCSRLPALDSLNSLPCSTGNDFLNEETGAEFETPPTEAWAVQVTCVAPDQPGPGTPVTTGASWGTGATCLEACTPSLVSSSSGSSVAT